MEINPEKSHSREPLSVEIENFEKNLKTYRDLVSKEKDIFETVRKSSEDFMMIVDKLIINSHNINKRVNDTEETKDLPKDRIDHYKIMFNHYDSYFLVQKKTAETFLRLEEQKKRFNIGNITLLRERFSSNPQMESENKLKV